MGHKLCTTLLSLLSPLKPNRNFIENFKNWQRGKRNKSSVFDREHRVFDLPKLSPLDLLYVNDSKYS